MTNLLFSGSAEGWQVSYAGLAVNKVYTAVVTATDNAGRAVSASATFDTFNPGNFTFEAEDYDYGGGHFIDNPQTNAYATRAAIDGVDCHNASGGDASYRPNPSGLATENAGDLRRAAYGGGLPDFDVGWNNGGNWGNYTRTFPAGVFNIYMRAASPNGSPVTTDAASLYLVTSGLGTSTQTTTKLGTFSVPNTRDWHGFAWVPLKAANGDVARITNNGAAKTLRITTDNGGYNVNFYELVPTSLSADAVVLGAALAGGDVVVSFLGQIGFSYQLQYKDQLTDVSWLPLGSSISGTRRCPDLERARQRQRPLLPAHVSPLMNPKLILVLTAAACAAAPLQAQDAPAVYRTPRRRSRRVVQDLLGRMTTEEKARQLDMYFGCQDFLDTNQTIDITHAKPDAVFNPALAAKVLGNLGAGSVHDVYPHAALYNALQSWIIHSSRLGIPALFLEEGLHGFMSYDQTVFPQTVNLAPPGTPNWRARPPPPSPPRRAPAAWI